MNINLKWSSNPFYVYIVSFLLVFLFYSLKWSNAYPDLSYDLILFFVVTFIIAFIIGFLCRKGLKIIFTPINKLRYPMFITSFVLFVFFIEFLQFGGIPLIMAFTNISFVTKEFTGIPTVHTIVSTFASFYSIYLYNYYLGTKRKKILFYIFLMFLPHVLSVNRGPIVITLSGFFLMYLIKRGSFSVKSIIWTSVGILLFLFVFGLVGNLRSSASRNDSSFLLKLTGANERLEKSIIPKEYYWTYLYAASPIGNFQNAINITEPNPSFMEFTGMFITEIIPDFIARRFISFFDIEISPKNYLVIRVINTGTVYAESYLSIGWIGPGILFIYSIISVFLFLLLVPRRSSFFLSGWCILLTIFLFNTFNNMWRESALSFQLIYPVIFSSLEKYKIYFI